MQIRPNVTPLRAPGLVWLASYLKSGNTWLRVVLTNYLRDDGEPVCISDDLVGRPLNSREAFSEFLGLDSSDMTDEEVAHHLPRFRRWLAEECVRSNRPGFAKTHDVYRLPGGPARFPRTDAANVVYLIRNPLDVAVSYAHHLNWSLDRTIQRMNNPAAGEARIPSGIIERLPEPMVAWSDHVASWIGQTGLPLHLARYEDLLVDPHAGFGAIVRFAGLEWDGPRLDRAIERSAFHRLQAQEQERESRFAERQPKVPSFFRAGVAGSWRTVLTRAQVRALVEVHGEVMERFGYLKEARAFLRG